MGFPSRYRQFFIIVVELFIILKLYDVFQENFGGSPKIFLIIGFIFFWLLNWFLGKIQLGRNLQETFLDKFIPRMTFSNQWFGLGIATSVFFGYYLSKVIPSAFLVVLIIVILLVFAIRLMMQSQNLLRYSWGLVLFALIFGIAIGNEFTSSTFVVFIFVMGFILMYLTKAPNEY